MTGNPNQQSHLEKCLLKMYFAKSLVTFLVLTIGLILCLVPHVSSEALTAKILPYTNSCFGTTVANITNSKIYFYFAVIFL